MSTSPRSAAVKRDWGSDETDCVILHVDMDAFFASCEIARHPELAGRPVIIGTGARAVVSTANYEAREFGVHSAQAVTAARRLCPNGVFLPVDHRYYSQVSRQIFTLIRSSVTDAIEQVSVDEAYIDVRHALRIWKSPVVIARWIRAEVSSLFHVTCSVGIASNMLIAKLASTNAKPDGMLLIPKARQAEFIQMLPLAAIPGIGPALTAKFAKWGVRTVAQLAATDESMLRRITGSGSLAHTLMLASQGISTRKVTPRTEEKSIGAERTFLHDTDDRETVVSLLRRCSNEVATRLRAKGLVARTVTLKLRFADLSYSTRSRSVDVPFDSAARIREIAYELLDSARITQPIRLAGLSVSHLTQRAQTAVQGGLDLGGITPGKPESSSKSDERRTASLSVPASARTQQLASPTQQKNVENAEAALDSIRRKYGSKAAHLGVYSDAGFKEQ